MNPVYRADSEVSLNTKKQGCHSSEKMVLYQIASAFLLSCTVLHVISSSLANDIMSTLWYCQYDGSDEPQLAAAVTNWGFLEAFNHEASSTTKES
jgi:hypothetical protein